MPRIDRLCVYCGSSDSVDQQYRAAATELGTTLAAAGIELVYGGGRIGLMGLLADAVLAGRGRVTGVIPTRLRDRELAHPGASELLVVGSMHERKQIMAERADAFAVLPGGTGTLDETFEIVTWRQLGLHDKPIFLVDIGGYWQPLIDLFEHIVAQGFARPLVPQILQIVPSVPALLAALRRAEPGGETRSELLCPSSNGLSTL